MYVNKPDKFYVPEYRTATMILISSIRRNGVVKFVLDKKQNHKIQRNLKIPVL